jgi:enterochelin esterase-like enzyme
MPEITADAALFSLPDEGFRAVALAHELRRPREVPFERNGREWRLRLERPPVARLEYLLEIDSERVPDPTNPLRAPGPFGDKSVLEFPEYTVPEWVEDEDSPPGDHHELTLHSALLRTSVDARLWTAEGAGADAPLLVVHDGGDYTHYSLLLRLLDHLVAFGEVPPFRAALLPPPLDRGETYSASARYARALAEEWVPSLADGAPAVGLGASLGALALLHAQWNAPGLFRGLLLQSGSFFRRNLDGHEWGNLKRFTRITRFVSRVVGGRHGVQATRLRMTCGSGEENLDNNRFLAATLARQGWDVRLTEHPDAHNWISFRDSLQPHLGELLRG